MSLDYETNLCVELAEALQQAGSGSLTTSIKKVYTVPVRRAAGINWTRIP